MGRYKYKIQLLFLYLCAPLFSYTPNRQNLLVIKKIFISCGVKSEIIKSFTFLFFTNSCIVLFIKEYDNESCATKYLINY